mmetsp:Transcript_8618/g.34032  ORF Transcript_8618/g.34032 Transcript_8618/m.34032 type:complete len:528 (+) Transcript_8618:228-1811(+)
MPHSRCTLSSGLPHSRRRRQRNRTAATAGAATAAQRWLVAPVMRGPGHAQRDELTCQAGARPRSSSPLSAARGGGLVVWGRKPGHSVARGHALGHDGHGLVDAAHAGVGVDDALHSGDQPLGGGQVAAVHGTRCGRGGFGASLRVAPALRLLGLLGHKQVQRGLGALADAHALKELPLRHRPDGRSAWVAHVGGVAQAAEVHVCGHVCVTGSLEEAREGVVPDAAHRALRREVVPVVDDERGTALLPDPRRQLRRQHTALRRELHDAAHLSLLQPSIGGGRCRCGRFPRSGRGPWRRGRCFPLEVAHSAAANGGPRDVLQPALALQFAVLGRRFVRDLGQGGRQVAACRLARSGRSRGRLGTQALQEAHAARSCRGSRGGAGCRWGTLLGRPLGGSRGGGSPERGRALAGHVAGHVLHALGRGADRGGGAGRALRPHLGVVRVDVHSGAARLVSHVPLQRLQLAPSLLGDRLLCAPLGQLLLLAGGCHWGLGPAASLAHGAAKGPDAVAAGAHPLQSRTGAARSCRC